MTHPDDPQRGANRDTARTDEASSPWSPSAHGQPAPWQPPTYEHPTPWQPPGNERSAAHSRHPAGHGPGAGDFSPPPPKPRRVNGLAVASLVLGLLWLYGIGSILGLIFGYLARKQIRTRGDAGGGLATAGIVLGWLSLAFILLVLVFAVVTG